MLPTVQRELVRDVFAVADPACAGVVSAGGARPPEEGVLMSSEALAVEYVGTYLAIKRQIGELEEKAEEARKAVREILYPDGVSAGSRHIFEGLGTVEGVKGRVSEKLDRARLARAGIAPEVLDAATVRTEGEPSMRISAARGDADAA